MEVFEAAYVIEMNILMELSAIPHDFYTVKIIAYKS
jgi:hypothetical protein